jgi:hypothetical protein
VNEEIGANVEEETGGRGQLNQHNHQNDIIGQRKPVPFGVFELEVGRLDQLLAVLVGVRRAATKADERLAILVVDVSARASLTLTGGNGSGGIVDALALVNRLGVAIVAAHLLDNGRRCGLLQHKTRVATHVVVDVAGGDASAQACIGQLVKDVLTVLGGGHGRGRK